MQKQFTLEVPEFSGFEFIALRAPKAGEWIAPVGRDYGWDTPVKAATDFNPKSIRFIYKKLEPITHSTLTRYPIARLKEINTTENETHCILRNNFKGHCSTTIGTAKTLDPSYWPHFAIIKENK